MTKAPTSVPGDDVEPGLHAERPDGMAAQPAKNAGPGEAERHAEQEDVAERRHGGEDGILRQRQGQARRIQRQRDTRDRGGHFQTQADRRDDEHGEADPRHSRMQAWLRIMSCTPLMSGTPGTMTMPGATRQSEAVLAVEQPRADAAEDPADTGDQQRRPAPGLEALGARDPGAAGWRASPRPSTR